MDTHNQKAALWQCDDCGLWWCSQPQIEPTRFLLALSFDLFEELGWDNFRGWRLGGTPHVATCPGCQRVSLRPVLGQATAGPPLQIAGRDLLRPPVTVLASAGVPAR